jgi:hypothetical protein
MFFRGYIDESYSKKIFTLSCIMSEQPDWHKIELSWKKVLGSKNRELMAQGRLPISRYHASDCSSRVNEFAAWSVEEQIDFTRKLLRILERRFLNVVAYSVPLEDFVEIFPEYAGGDPLPECYGLLLRFLMIEFVKQIDAVREKGIQVNSLHVVLIHERSRYDGALRRAFTSMLNDQTFRGREYFSTLTAMSWEECVPLQVADLLAYENFKDSERAGSGRDRRKTLQIMLANGLGGRSRRFDANSLREFRAVVDSKRKQGDPKT